MPNSYPVFIDDIPLNWPDPSTPGTGPACFVVDAVDFSDCVLLTGFGWEYNDIDDEESGRTHDTIMHRKVLGTKRKLTVTCRRLSFTRLHALIVALHNETISVKYLEPEAGDYATKTFYGTKVKSGMAMSDGTETYWDGTSFELVEV